MKKADLSQLSTSDLYEKLKEERTGLDKMWFTHTITPVENPMRIPHTKKNIARMPLLEIAKTHHVPAVAIAFDLPRELCVARDQARQRQVGHSVISRHIRELKASLRGLQKEGFHTVSILSSADEVDAATITLTGGSEITLNSRIASRISFICDWATFTGITIGSR